MAERPGAIRAQVRQDNALVGLDPAYLDGPYSRMYLSRARVAQDIMTAGQVIPMVTIGGQTYRVSDTGRAQRLVPYDPMAPSPAEQAQRRLALERALFMAAYPLAGAIYGVAALAGASDRGRERALAVGASANAALMAASPLGARPATPARAHPMPPWASQRRPDIRMSDLNANRQATRVDATISRPMLGTGSEPKRSLTPVGWRGHGSDYNEGRGHLLARRLGGRGEEIRNIVTIQQIGANNPKMSNFERETARRVRAGEVIEYQARPLYGAGVTRPEAIFLTATGSRGAPVATIIGNPQDPRR